MSRLNRPDRRLLWLAMLFVAALASACQPSSPAASPSPADGARPTASPAGQPSAPSTAQPTGPYRAQSPEYGFHVFLWGHPETTERDLSRVTNLHFTWIKQLFQWRDIEGACKGCFDWSEADRVVSAANQAGVKIIARVDFQPKWARADDAHNGPPDNYQDYADFIKALVERYRTGSSIGRIHAVEVWNEVNLAREWGGQPINREQAGDYVRLLKMAYQAAKAADPSITVLSAGLSPTGWNDDTARPDDVYLQWLYDAGLKGSYDALTAHGNTQAPDPEMEIGSWQGCENGTQLCQDGSFYFRRVEQLRDIMVKNGDGDKQIWLLEFGWTADEVHPQYSWFAVPETRKGENLVRAFQFAAKNWAPWIGVMTVWTLPDPTWTREREEYWWAVVLPHGQPRESYRALEEAREKGLLPGLPGEATPARS